jgi:hypothetical protein
MSFGGPKQLGFKVSYWAAIWPSTPRQEQPPEIKLLHALHSGASSCSSQGGWIPFPASTSVKSLPQSAAGPLPSSADAILQVLRLGGSLIQAAPGLVVAAVSALLQSCSRDYQDELLLRH